MSTAAGHAEVSPFAVTAGDAGSHLPDVGAEKPASRAPAEVENGTAQALGAPALPLSTQNQQDHHLGQNLIIIHRLLEILLYFRGSVASL